MKVEGEDQEDSSAVMVCGTGEQKLRRRIAEVVLSVSPVRAVNLGIRSQEVDPGSVWRVLEMEALEVTRSQELEAFSTAKWENA